MATLRELGDKLDAAALEWHRAHKKWIKATQRKEEADAAYGEAERAYNRALSAEETTVTTLYTFGQFYVIDLDGRTLTNPVETHAEALELIKAHGWTFTDASLTPEELRGLES